MNAAVTPVESLAVAPASEDKIVSVRLDEIRTDGGTQSRAGLSADTVGQYAEALANGAKFPYIVVFYGPDDREPERAPRYWLASGFHRYHAMLRRGIAAEFVRVRYGSRREAILFSVGANHQHGLQRSREDKRWAVRLLLSDAEWCNKSSHWIADKCHVSDDLVNSVKDEIVAAKQLQESGNSCNAVPLSVSDSGSVIEARNGEAGGGQRRMQTGRIGRKRVVKIKPVMRETEGQEKAKKLAQLVRSIPKAVRQAKALGWTWEQFGKECQAVWDLIPVVEE